MPESPLYDLYRLHLVDAALEGMKRRANALDGGKSLLQAISAIKAEHGMVLTKPKKLEESIKELEGTNAGYVTKIKAFEKELYGGNVVNAKEAAGYEAEIASLKKIIAQHEDEMMAMMEELPVAQELAKPKMREMQALAKQFEAKKAADIEEGKSLQLQYNAKAKERAPLAAAVQKPLLSQYDMIRAKYGGLGMGVLSGSACGACGTLLPTKVIESLNHDRIVTCESCHRILIKLVPG